MRIPCAFIGEEAPGTRAKMKARFLCGGSAELGARGFDRTLGWTVLGVDV